MTPHYTRNATNDASYATTSYETYVTEDGDVRMVVPPGPVIETSIPLAALKDNGLDVFDLSTLDRSLSNVESYRKAPSRVEMAYGFARSLEGRNTFCNPNNVYLHGERVYAPGPVDAATIRAELAAYGDRDFPLVLTSGGEDEAHEVVFYGVDPECMPEYVGTVQQVQSDARTGSRRPFAPRSQVTAIVYDPITRTLDRGTLRSVGWDNKNALASTFRVGSGRDVTLPANLGASGANCIPMTEYVERKYIRGDNTISDSIMPYESMALRHRELVELAYQNPSSLI